LKKKSFAIDNLAVDLSSDTEEGGSATGTNSDPTNDPNQSSGGFIGTQDGAPGLPGPGDETDGPAINQAAVPEPSSFLLFAAGLVFGWFRSSRSR
jgi:hypothetical protein